MASPLPRVLLCLKANGYQVDSSKIITTGVTGLLFAPLGGFAYNLAAITGRAAWSQCR
ncbi:benzoate/H(+) symporter BenE family transporter [Vibrio lentus]|nr:benzoate/H(+) symporter BenE family transporter [Vibrio lentus]